MNKNTYDKQALVAHLRALGVRPGMKLEVHSSLSALGWIEGGAETVIDALQEVLTPEGTLMMPTFNHGAPYNKGEIFDVRKTPTIDGKITDTFWRRDDVLRGINPTHAFAAWGKDAAYYVCHDQEAPTMGADSPLDRLSRDGGYVLLLGVGCHANTYHHVVETMTGCPCLDPQGEEYEIIDGEGKHRRALTWSWRDAPCPVCDQKRPLYTDAINAIASLGKVGDGDCTLYPMREGFDAIAGVLTPHCKDCTIRPRVCEYTVKNHTEAEVMTISNEGRAEILIQALPYIQKYTGKIVVIKYGGNAMINEELKQAVMRDVVLLNLVGVKVVLVHGGGPEISDMLKRLGKKPEFVDGLRVTDTETMEVVQMVLAGKVNKTLVNLLELAGGHAMGLCGTDGHLITARQLKPELGFVGEVTGVNPQPILDVLEKGYIPVVSTIGCDDEGNLYNINADTAAARIAGALGAESMISMTDIVGLLRDKDDDSTLIKCVTMDDAVRLREEGVISGGMIPKVECCMEAIREGVQKVFIIDGRVPHSILIEMFTNEGLGTMFKK